MFVIQHTKWGIGKSQLRSKFYAGRGSEDKGRRFYTSWSAYPYEAVKFESRVEVEQELREIKKQDAVISNYVSIITLPNNQQ